MTTNLILRFPKTFQNHLCLDLAIYEETNSFPSIPSSKFKSSYKYLPSINFIGRTFLLYIRTPKGG